MLGLVEPHESSSVTTFSDFAVAYSDTENPDVVLSDQLGPISWWPVVPVNNFEKTDDQGWPSGKEEDSVGEIRRSILDGNYRWFMTFEGEGYWIAVPDGLDPMTDFYVTVDGFRANGPVDTGFGLVFRYADSENYYDFQVNDNFEYSIGITRNGDRKMIVGWSPSEALATETYNWLTVVGRGDQFFFFINDRFVYDLEDKNFPAGQVGVFAGLDYAAKNVNIYFRNFEIRTP
ncbi:MAG: hypothetical protein DWQ07_07245 [Chloroflexi bacterium]|nr:MAG: hypothetical protein DWQ07_07245 [Chloroflexota bacterium]MBL1195504.1 hypothetical protein [Chloroflexota bacterium]